MKRQDLIKLALIGVASGLLMSAQYPNQNQGYQYNQPRAMNQDMNNGDMSSGYNDDSNADGSSRNKGNCPGGVCRPRNNESQNNNGTGTGYGKNWTMNSSDKDNNDNSDGSSQDQDCPPDSQSDSDKNNQRKENASSKSFRMNDSGCSGRSGCSGYQGCANKGQLNLKRQSR